MKRILFILPLFFLLLSITIYAQNENKGWEKKSNFQGQLDNAIGLNINNTGYVCIGVGGVQYKKECWKYDEINDTWIKVADMPGEARIASVGFTIGNKGYIGTGLIGLDNNQKGADDFWEYDAENNQWTKKADLPGGMRYGAIGFSIEDKGYIAFGATENNFYKDLWEYDSATDKRTKKADFPEEGRVDASAFVLKNKAYILLGAQKKNITPKKKNVWEYNPQTDKWTEQSEFPGPARIGASAFSIYNKGYIYGGFNRLKLRYQDMWEYDPILNLWAKKEDAACGARSYAFSFVIENAAYIGTGKKGLFGSNDFWKYSVEPSPHNENSFTIGATIFFGDSRAPSGGTEIELLDKNNKVVQKTTTNIFGSFLFQSLPDDEDYTIAVKYDAHIIDQKMYLVNRSNKPIATLEKSNDFKYHSRAGDANIALLKIDNNNMRMNLNGKLALNDNQKTPLKNTSVSLISEVQEVIQMTTTDEEGSFTFTYLPLDSSLYVSVGKEDLASLPKEAIIVLMDENRNVIKKASVANASFKFFNLPSEKNTLTKMYVEDPWMETMYMTKNKCTGTPLSVIENIYWYRHLSNN